jgi:hypothetical protein
MRNAGLLCAAVLTVCATTARAGQPVNIQTLPDGARYCPAPWADNSEFMSSYFSVDARTGQMTRHDANSGPVGMTPEPEAKEEVLFVSPPISVENIYVPPPGGPALPPQTRATGVFRQPRQQQRAYPRPQQQYRQAPNPVALQPYPQAQYPQYPRQRQQPYPAGVAAAPVPPGARVPR